MTETFDPYHKWLGIPPAEQPAHLYRLLGIAAFETDLDVIEGAADRQMTHVQTHKTGPHAAVSQQILNELAAAKLCLLNAPKKAAYDAQLRSTMSAGAAAPRRVTAPRPVPRAAPAPRAVADVAEEEPAIDVRAGRGGSASYRRRRRSNAPIVVGTLGLGLAAIVVLLVVAGQQTDEPQGGASGTSVTTSRGGGGRARVSTNPRTNGGKTSGLQPGNSALWDGDGRQDSDGGDGTSGGADAGSGNGDGANNGGDNAPITPDGGGRSERGGAGEENRAAERRSLADVLSPGSAPPRQRAPVPSEDEQKQIVREIRERFDADYRKATTPESRFKLAEKLFLEGTKTDDPVSRYVLLKKAEEYAASVGAPIGAVMAVEELDKGYEVDGLKRKSEVLLEAARNATLQVAIEAAVRTAMELAEQAVAAERFDLANQFFRAGRIAAAKSGERARKLKLVNDRDKEVGEIAKLYDGAMGALAKLAADADDPAANEAAGVYLCLAKDQWPDGLPFLAKAQQSELSALAAQELEDPADSREQTELADAWYAYGKRGKDLLEVRGLVRARYWYRKARSRLDGADRTRVDTTVQQIQDALRDSPWSDKVTG